MISIAADKGRLACEAMKLEIPLYKGESYTLISSNDVGRIASHIVRLEATISCLIDQLENSHG